MRPIYGGGPEDVYLVTDADGDLQSGGGYPALFYDGQQEGANRYTDLLTMDGDPVTFVLTADGVDPTYAKGQITRFQGPDEVWEMWCSVNGSPRFLLTGKPGPAIKELREQVASLGSGGGGGGGALSALTDVDGSSVNTAPPGAALVKGASGVWAAGQVPVNYSMTGAQAVPLPFGEPADGERRQWRALASGADRTVTFDAEFRTSDKVTARAIVVPSGQVLLAEAEYSSMLGGWVLTRAAITTGAGTGIGDGGGAQTLSAGPDAQLTTSQTFTRTATEPSGATITGREWKIVSGPLGTGMVVGTAAALSWKPGSSAAGSNDIRNPTIQEMAYQLTSTAENSTTDWPSAYDYIEDINDDRGYTAGLVGFCSGTGDMLRLVQQYAVEKTANNLLSPYIPGLQKCVDVGYGPGASAAAASNLGTAYINAWISAATNDPIFRKVQRDFRKSMYWDDALTQALADGVGPLGLAIYYDVLVNHGVGTDSESFGGILSYVRARNTKPASGGNMATWLNAVTDRRNTILQGWGDDQATDGRVYMHRLLINGGTVSGTAQPANLNLVAPVKWSCYGDVFTIAARPDPVPDGLLGQYVLRYTATGAGSDDVTVTVA